MKLEVWPRSLCYWALLCLVSCSTLSAMDSPSEKYRSYLEDHLKVGENYDRGRRLVVIKALAVTSELKSEQEKVAPDFSVNMNEAKSQVVVAVGLAHPGAFTKTDLKFDLAGLKPELIKELTSSPEIQTLYPFAFPYYRVFLVEFPKHEMAGVELGLKSFRGPAKVTL
jgi:hypothetical protein